MYRAVLHSCSQGRVWLIQHSLDNFFCIAVTMPSHKSTLQQKNHSKWQWELYTQKSQCQKKDLSREKLIGRWKQLLTLRMTLPGLKKTDVLQSMAMMCPGHEVSFEEVKHICEQRDFYMAPPKRQKKKSDDGAPSVPNAPDPPRKLMPLEVHFINIFYLDLKKEFELGAQVCHTHQRCSTCLKILS